MNCRLLPETVAMLVLVLPGGVAAEKQAMLLEDGFYEVEVRLELPHLEDMAAKKSVTVCLSGADASGVHGLAVLSDNNPLGKCPVSNVRRDGATLTFDVVCEGGNAARASAAYTLAPQGFVARIAMKMGGKNMTMTEVQRGRRAGACTAAVNPRS